ncbi:stress protein DDR48 [Salvia miltiorrhiza]|uniref:stress protein DDR48 n=1 Tax=Salvia miltiorrhiza TaxID=226208 RepID=UPI0025AD23B0|nr:stress protein DDR48 [Salvia miltiorrhiza]
MNSSYGKSNNKSGSVNAFDFDLGLGSGRSRPMNDKRNQTPSYSPATYAYSSAQQKPTTASSSWTHQPVLPAQSGPTSMVGDIFGKSWNSPAPPSSSASVVGVVNGKNPNLFSDLVNSAIGGNKSSSNVPLKNTAPAPSQNTFSMGSVGNSLPKTSYSVGGAAGAGSNVSSSGGNVNYGGSYSKSSSLGGGNSNLGGGSVRSPNIGVPSMKSMAGSGVGGVGMGSSKDPFGSLVDFGSKSSAGMKSASKASEKSGFGDDLFGGFQNATSNSSGAAFPTSNNDDPFGDSFGNFQNASSKMSGSSVSSGAFSTNNSDPLGDSFGNFQNATSKTGGSSFSSGAFPTSNNDPLGDFGFSSSVSTSQSQPQKQSSGANGFDVLFSSSGGGGTGGAEGFTSQQFSEGDDWGINEEFGGSDSGGTTELEGLPPPPAGVSASSAKNKGMENYKNGQFADAIKWLSWAVVLLEKAGDDDGTTDVLVNRASCYKEVGEYKKAVADCTKVLEREGKNVSVLVQRALLYESMEKYKLGAEDLRTVMNLDPGNRVARSTIHRLTKMAG